MTTPELNELIYRDQLQIRESFNQQIHVAINPDQPYSPVGSSLAESLLDDTLGQKTRKDIPVEGNESIE